MTDESDTSAFAETDSVTPEQTDTAPDYVFWDPEDDQDTPEDAEEVATDDGTEEPDDEDPDDSEPEEAEGEEDGEDEAEPEGTYHVLPSGEKISTDELTKGYLRQQDYTRKTQEVSQQRQSLEAEVQRLQGVQDAFIDHISSMVPKPPDASLAMSDPNAYTRQKAAYDAAIAQVQKLIEIGQQPKEIKQKLDEGQRREYLERENARLAERYPEVTKPKERQQFFAAAAQAAKEAGFSDEELNGIADHRLFVLAKMASEGLSAKQARAKAKEKSEKAPPVTPRKANGQKRNRNAEAMKRLTQTGSIRDALQVDFD